MIAVGRVVVEETGLGIGACCPIQSMVRAPYDGIIGDVPLGTLPFERLCEAHGTLRRHAYSIPAEGEMDGRMKARAEQAKGLPDELSRLNLKAAGIDVGASSHFVAVSEECADEPVREFEAYTAELYRMADWLVECGVTTVAMESTGVYWIPLFGVLEERGLEALLVDPRRLKSVPGRKTDVLDCQWQQQLHTYGLLSGAFRPEAEIRRLRSYLRQRMMLVEYASHHIQHMQKALTQMNIKLQHVLSDITGVTGMRIIEAIVRGERNPRKLAKLRDYRTKKKEKKIARSLRGHWREEHIFELTQALELTGRTSAQDRGVRSGDRGAAREVRGPQRRRCAVRQARQEASPGQRAEVRRSESPLPHDRCGPDRNRRCGQLHGTEGGE